MKNKFYLINLTMLLMACLFVNTAQAVLSNVTDYNAQVTASSLNVRSGPGTGYRIIGSVRNNDTVRVTHHDGNWRKINWQNGANAYVHGSYVKKLDTPPSSADTNVTDYDGVVTADTLNVRSGPSTANGIIGKRYRNQKVRVTHHSGVWRKIAWSGGSSAYVHGSYVNKIINTPTRKSRQFNITVKSYLANIGSNRGSFGKLAVMDNTELFALAKLTDGLFSELPNNDRKDDLNGDYRLYTNLRVNATCTNNNLSVSHTLSSDAGREPFPIWSVGSIKPSALIGQFVQNKDNASTWSFRYYMKGKPDIKLEPNFQLVRFRANPYIWHKIGGKILCKNNNPTWIMNEFAGSKFPSHRYWVDGTQYSTHTQGDFVGLWSLTKPTLDHLN